MIAASGGAAVAAAAEAERVRRQEEEEMTGYSPKDLTEDWEFKILRSQTGVFRKPEKLRAVLDEERRGGWVLVEKFDNQRIRLKRPAGTKVVEDDLAPHPYDPYRTELGITPGVMVAMFVAIALTLLVAAFFFLVVFWTAKTVPQPALLAPPPARVLPGPF